jgi:putative addiction module component (TIGR02574 family)
MASARLEAERRMKKRARSAARQVRITNDRAEARKRDAEAGRVWRVELERRAREAHAGTSRTVTLEEHFKNLAKLLEKPRNPIVLQQQPVVDARIELCLRFLRKAQRYVEGNRYRIADLLLDELPPDGTPAQVHASWVKELQRRMDDTKAGRSRTYTLEEVRALFAKRRIAEKPQPTLQQRYAALRKKYARRLERGPYGVSTPSARGWIGGWPAAVLRLRRMHWAGVRPSIRSALEFGFSRSHAEREACGRLLYEEGFDALARPVLRERLALRLLEADDYVKTNRWRRLCNPAHPRIWEKQ